MTPKPLKRLYLIDAMALAYRSHFIFINRPLMNSRGENTSATYGFTSALLKLIEDHSIEHMAVVFDVLDQGGTFRDELYDEYKANRDPPPDDLIANVPMIKEVVEAFDVPVIEVGGVEADDVIGTLARKAEGEGAEVVIVSPDKDFQQLLSGTISMFRPAYRGEEFAPITADSFREKFGVEPVRFIDILALMGDASDNVPGVPGIGEKTAVKLLQSYGSVENLLAHADEVKGKKAREGLQQHADAARLSKRLVTIKTDLEVPLDWTDLHRANPDLDAITRVFDRLEFNTLLRRTQRILGRNGATLGSKEAASARETPGSTTADGAAARGRQTVDPSERAQGDLFAPETRADSDEQTRYDQRVADYMLVTDRAALERCAVRLASVDKFAMDVRLDGGDPMLASVVGIAFAFGEADGCFVPVPLPDGTTEKDIFAVLAPAAANATDRVAHEIKDAMVALGRRGWTLRGRWFDTRVAHYLVAPEQPHEISRLARTYLAYESLSYDELVGSGRARRSERDLAPAQLCPYACERADIALRLEPPIRADLERAGLLDIATRVELPLIEVLAGLEQRGIRVDPDILGAISVEMERDIEVLAARIYDLAGREFNIGSPAQLGEILFEELALPVISKTSGGKASTRETVLQELATMHELPGNILDWRELSKLKSTYVDALPALIHPETGRIHTRFNQTVAATGRLSSQNPNLQNIPVRSARGRQIRRAFVAAEGRRLMSADYVQIELRILASMSGDEALAAAFRSGEDIHTATAARVFHIDPATVDRRHRSKAKEVNYGIPYGMSAFGLAQRLRCSRSEAQELIDGYMSSFPSVARFLSEQVERVRELGYAETLMGRRRYVAGINARNRNERAAAERIAVNMPIQGSQADMIKVAMLRIGERLASEDLASCMLLQVHDELVFETAGGEEEVLTRLVREEMEAALPLDVPVEVDIHIADNWLDAH